MDSHTISALNRLEVVETGRRRCWSEEEKARIVLESLSEPRLVAATARRYGLSRSLLVTWRRAFAAERTKSEAGFVRAVVAEDGPVASVAASSESATAHSTERRIEIELAGGRRVIVDAGVDVEALRRRRSRPLRWKRCLELTSCSRSSARSMG
ncbi:transposase [Bradyrhizobium sp. LCT2]|uniref:IS66-like element accessory protein TnpA n=1 Tax=Bradyrhizobium sp. LCT2 TaxID=2493093 RepID=UPI001FEE290D|nr:transposase [Bradyrhizobium sp. LCT2]